MGLLRDDNEEQMDIEAEAEHWKNYKGNGRCLFVLMALVGIGMALPSALWWVLT